MTQPNVLFDNQLIFFCFVAYAVNSLYSSVKLFFFLKLVSLRGAKTFQELAHKTGSCMLRQQQANRDV